MISDFQAGDEVPQGDPFVGRDQEMDAIAKMTTTVEEWSGSMLLVSGEPGIAESRLIEEAERLALAEGYVCHWGRCFEDQGAPPF